MEGGEGRGRGEQRAMGMSIGSQLIKTCVWLLEVREVNCHSCDFIKKGGNQGSYQNSFVTCGKKGIEMCVCVCVCVCVWNGWLTPASPKVYSCVDHLLASAQ